MLEQALFVAGRAGRAALNMGSVSERVGTRCLSSSSHCTSLQGCDPSARAVLHSAPADKPPPARPPPQEREAAQNTFASKVAAIQDQYADASIGNVTGSNAVNVFLGIGVAWSIAAVFHQWNGEYFRVQPGTLAFSVTLFTIFAFVCIAVLMYRRRPEIGGELGGPRNAKRLTSGLFFSLWLLYIVLSSLEAYCIIKGF
ncbi:hypothetical protein MHYP_G00302540 [Metynnis hypsauchen]